jgi:hypothetical protein
LKYLFISIVYIGARDKNKKGFRYSFVVFYLTGIFFLKMKLLLFFLVFLCFCLVLAYDIYFMTWFTMYYGVGLFVVCGVFFILTEARLAFDNFISNVISRSRVEHKASSGSSRSVGASRSRDVVLGLDSGMGSTQSNVTMVFRAEQTIKPPVFKKGDDVRIWWQRFSSYVRSAKLGCTDLKEILTPFLDNASLRKVVYMTTPWHFLSLENLKNRLIELLSGVSESRTRVLGKFYHRRQRCGELLVDYAVDLCELADRGFDYGGARFEKELSEKFIEGLIDVEIKRWVKSENHPTFNSVFNAAMKCEQEFRFYVVGKNNEMPEDADYDMFRFYFDEKKTMDWIDVGFDGEAVGGEETLELELNADPVLKRAEHVVTVASEISREPVDDQSDNVVARASKRVETGDELAIEVEAYENEHAINVHEVVVSQQEDEMDGSLCSDVDVGDRDIEVELDDSGCELDFDEEVDDRGELDTSGDSGCELEFDETQIRGAFIFLAIY